MTDWDNLVEPARGALEALLRKGDEMADRIEELEDHLASMAGLWAKSDSEKQLLLGRIEELEAKLSKAVEALSYYADHEILYQYDDASFAKDTITELKGQKEELKPKGRGPWPNAIRAVNYRVGTNEDGGTVWAHRIEQYHEGRWTAIRVFNESEDGTLEEEPSSNP